MELRGEPADIVALDRAAVLESVRLVGEARPGDWRRPTPCDRWTLRELVAHMAAQHHAFATAARGEGAGARAERGERAGATAERGERAGATAERGERAGATAERGERAGAAARRPPDPWDDPAGAYRSAAGTVLDAFARPGTTDRPFVLPEISARTVPGHRAIGFHFIDYVVHAWDVAATLGLRVLLPEPVLRAALPIALAVPGGEARRAPDSAFRPALPPDPGRRSAPSAGEPTGSDGSGTLSLILTCLGRHPGWTPPDTR
ncbi:maleylpyruvate isomerase family mycothiol-dependent enzyme [Streptomyces sp. NPDC005566]|uniref:maleylpyruvate isomerase family mycothiol-dependent enzyme n=1 Tax=Streptomyces sp. NPDC005566 TaxID=3156886 RepID=UPI0033AC35B0